MEQGVSINEMRTVLESVGAELVDVRLQPDGVVIVLELEENVRAGSVFDEVEDMMPQGWNLEGVWVDGGRMEIHVTQDAWR